MTTSSPGNAELRELVRAHGPELYRLAAMLTGDEGSAIVLTARTLTDRDAAATPVPPDRLKAGLVRHYIRAAPRRPEGVVPDGDDPGDVLRRLRPRARAASALHLVEGWDAERTAEAVGVTWGRVSTLVPPVPGLAVALAAVADQHTLSGDELEHSVLDATPEGERSRARWRGRGAAVAAVLSAALVVGFLQAEGWGSGGKEDGEEGSATLATLSQVGETDLTHAGWVLREDGEPPQSVNGVHLRETVTLDKGRRSASVDLPSAPDSAFAAFGVLWCDMPPAEDDHLVVPTGTLTVDDVQITLPCAGRQGSPPVTQVVPLPPSGKGLLELSGDLPGNGIAALGIYQENESQLVPAPRGDLTQGPPVEDGAVELDLPAGGTGISYGWRTTQSVSVAHGSTIRVWAGRTGSIAVNVDGVPATDDGDVAAWTALLTAYLDEPSEDGPVAQPDIREYADWATQQVDLRDGRWLVAAPDMVRTFTLPSQVTPGPDARRTVTVEVITENVEDHLQVVVSDALPGRVDTAPVTALATPDAPLFTTGHRLVGQWELPADGLARELRLDTPAGLPDELVILAARAPDPASWSPWGEGQISRGGEAVPFWFQGDMEVALQELRQPHFTLPPSGHGPVTVAVPPAPDHPTTTIVAYAPVPYEEFDFSAAALPADVWPAGSPRPDLHFSPPVEAYETAGAIAPADLRGGTVTVDVASGGEVAVQATTAGKGRIRFLIDGQPADGLWATDGWWSSWTDQPVTSVFTLAYPVSPPRAASELTVVVEGHEDFSLQVFHG